MDWPARAKQGVVTLGVDFLCQGAGTDPRWRRVPVRGADGQVAAALVVIVDDAERAARRSLLTREVDHRAKNMLAVVQAALWLTRADDIAGFVRAIEGRVAALARAQTILAANRWVGRRPARPAAGRARRLPRRGRRPASGAARPPAPDGPRPGRASGRAC